MADSPINKPINILLVEDNPADVYLVKRVLTASEGLHASVEAVDRVAAAMERLERDGVDVVLLDLTLPDAQGLHTFHLLRSSAPMVPIVVLTGHDDESIALEAVRVGAQDYLVKGKFNSALLSRAVRYALERHRLQLQLHALSLVDDLTGLYNRRGFLTLAAEDVRQARRRRGELVLAFADLDGLKAINDRHGHAEGDRAIRDAADILRHTFRDSDLIARLGGDEFVILLREAGPQSTERADARLRARLEAHNRVSGRAFPLSMSMGFARAAAGDDLDLERLIAAADSAMYRAKQGSPHRSASATAG